MGTIKVEGVDYPSWNWTMTEVISSGGLNRGYDPSMVVDKAGNLYIAWKYYMGGVNGSLYLSIWNVTTNSWSTPELISTESETKCSFPSLSIDTSDNLHFSWTEASNLLSSGDDNDIFYKYRNSTTSTWSSTELISVGSNVDSSKSETAVGVEGNVYVTWTEYTNFAGSDYDVAYNFRDETSGVWNTTEIVNEGSDDLSGFPDIGVDSMGNVHIIWLDYESNYQGSGTDVDVFYRLWNDTSSNWHDIEIVSVISNSFCTLPSLAIDLEGNAYCVWQDGYTYPGDESDYDVIYKMKNATNLIWTSPEVVSTESDHSIGSPEITVDSLNNVHVIWAESYNYSGEGSDRDYYYKFKNATNGVWNLTEVVSTESTDQAQDADLSVDQFGTVHIAWNDYSDYLGAGTDCDIHYKRLYINNLPSTVLEPIDPNPSTTGNVTLNWETVQFASKYYIYRSDSSISSLNGLNPIAVSSINSYQDYFVPNDDYYYVIVAATPYINSSMSNEETVVVSGPVISEFLPNAQLFIGLIVSTALIVTLIRRKKKH